jgi:hypothetical protein
VALACSAMYVYGASETIINMLGRVRLTMFLHNEFSSIAYYYQNRKWFYFYNCAFICVSNAPISIPSFPVVPATHGIFHQNKTEKFNYIWLYI